MMAEQDGIRWMEGSLEMGTLTFDQILRAVEGLTPEEQAVLIARLRRMAAVASGTVTREGVLAEFERRKAGGAFKNVESLRGKFAHPAMDLTFEEIQDMTGEAATAWENEPDELDGSR
jgi:hypothetical protein